ncbi:MAG: hypothetical protein ABIH92_05680 [Nanoarchaeota archaeon]
MATHQTEFYDPRKKVEERMAVIDRARPQQSRHQPLRLSLDFGRKYCTIYYGPDEKEALLEDFVVNEPRQLDGINVAGRLQMQGAVGLRKLRNGETVPQL